MELFFPNPRIDNEISVLLAKIKHLRNGDTSQLISRAGASYLKNYGVMLVHLREMAQKSFRDNELARRLWLREIRETMILATLLTEPEKLDDKELNQWGAMITTVELAEQMAINLLGKRPDSETLLTAWLNSSNPLQCHTAAMSIGWQYRFLGENGFAGLEDCMERLEEMSSHKQFIRPVGHALKMAGRFSPGYNSLVKDAIHNWKNSPHVSTRQLAHEIEYELEWEVSMKISKTGFSPPADSKPMEPASLEAYFERFRRNIVGIDATLETPYGKKPLVYADWIASGRLYAPIEDQIVKVIGPMVANTHSESSDTGMIMTNVYKLSHQIIKQHVHAGEDDIIITAGFGMTSVINKLQRIMGMRVPEQAQPFFKLPPHDRPVVFLTHMEHHSNHTSWLETNADVVVLEPDEDLLVNPEVLQREIKKYKNRTVKIGSFTACSNVTGIEAPYHQLARIMHQNDGFCFVDFAASAPYVPIDMHPADPLERLDAIFFSPHKFLGGPGSSGVMVFNSALYHNTTPDNSGGGTVNWTNRWGKYRYVEDIEAREDGGTPGFIQSIRAAMCIQLKEEMGCHHIRKREEEMVAQIFSGFKTIPGLEILAAPQEERLGAISFYIHNVHFNLVVRLLNDRFGIQVRGGCSCAGTYGHYLLHVDYYTSKNITQKIDSGDLSEKPGWVRLSVHPTMTNHEIEYMIDAVRQVAQNAKRWSKDYEYHINKNEYYHRNWTRKTPEDYLPWFHF